MIKIIDYIASYKDKNTMLSSVLKNAFNIKTDKELLFARADYIKMLDNLKSLSQDKETIEIIDEIIKIFSNNNLEKPTTHINLSKGHIATIKILYQMFKNSQDFQIKVDLKELLKKVKNFDSDVALEIITALEEFDIEFQIIGNRAYEKLYIKLLGIFVLYKDDIKNSPQPFKDILEQILNKVDFAKKIINSTKELTNSIKSLIEIIN
jgi:hypothetical protein